MKRTLVSVILLMVALSAGAQSLNRQIRNLAEDITREYMHSKKDLLIKPRIGIGDFTEESRGAVKNSVGSLISAMLTNALSRSTVFSVIERKNLEALMKEYKLSLSGFTSDATAPQLGELQGVELLLLGSVTEAGTTYLISTRLVDVETGKIAATAEVQVGRQEIEAESEKYLASTFQSPYGITLTPSTSVLLETGGNRNNFYLFSIDAGYRVTKWLSLSLGYATVSSGEMKGLDTPKITVPVPNETPSSYETTRYFNFSAGGIKLAAEAVVSPLVRLSVGMQLAAVLYANPILEQDFTDFPVWQPKSDGSGLTMLQVGQDRILVEGFNHLPYASFHAAVGVHYLISPRLSVYADAGGFYLPRFTPTSFEIAGRVRDTTINSDSDIDSNGTFPDYQNFNFAKNSSGDRIGFSAVGVSLQIGIAVHF